MKANYFSLIKYDADDNKVFDWKEPRVYQDENGEIIEEHLYVKTLFIGPLDSIDNYIEINQPESEQA